MWIGILSRAGAGATGGLFYKAKHKGLSCSFLHSRWAVELPARWEFPFLGDTQRLCWNSVLPTPGSSPVVQVGSPGSSPSFFLGCVSAELPPGPGVGRSVQEGRSQTLAQVGACPVAVGHGRSCCRELLGAGMEGVQPFIQRLLLCSPKAGWGDLDGADPVGALKEGKRLMLLNFRSPMANPKLDELWDFLSAL